MKQMMFVLTAVSALLPSAASTLPQHQVQTCSAAAWIWDTFVGGLGCSYR